MLVVDKDSTLQLGDAIVLHAIPELEKYWAFNIDTGDQYTLNNSAYYLLTQFRYVNKVSNALTEFANFFGIEIETAEEDCIPLLSDYYKHRFFKGGDK